MRANIKTISATGLIGNPKINVAGRLNRVNPGHVVKVRKLMVEARGTRRMQCAYLMKLTRPIIGRT